ncbi:hypothetical protein [Paludibaculum fermentans]|uniref:Uncharacterized protein n=1 Tax=Paludibaculum fermentans TaxID=1473598 RepID=A0A7S7NWU6_PALFE|nr:hypothetical protein [Paludibaculum fermentans]QOY91211.1 hypothetical protein IRI77_15060 [Paludibaculum fermentans]
MREPASLHRDHHGLDDAVRLSDGFIWHHSRMTQITMCTAARPSFLCDARLRVYFGSRLIQNAWTGVKPGRLGCPDGTHGRVYPYGEVSGSVTVNQAEPFTTDKCVL